MSAGAISTARQQKIEAELGSLETLTHAELKLRYSELTNDPPPKRIRRKLLTLAVAYETLCKPHRERLIVGPRGEAADVAGR